MKLDVKDFERKMQKSIEAYENELKSIRAGRANPGVLDKITVDYYGSPTQISSVAQVSVPDARTITITPWDKSMLKAIEKAIQASELGINPQNDGSMLRLSFPPLTEERRKELVKQIHKYAENGKVAIRNIRRDAIEHFKKAQKASEITEDELKVAEKDLQKLTDDSCKELDVLLANKEKELMSV
jgi:ribosome recycling factor